MIEGSVKILQESRSCKCRVGGDAAVPVRFQAFGDSAILRLLMKNAGFLACYLVFVTSANILLKLAAGAHGTWTFVTMLAAGNVAGFAGVLVYTGLLRTLPLHVAFPLSRGLVVLSVQLVAALVVFHESFRFTEAAGAMLVAAGIILVGVSASKRTEEAG